MERLDKAMDQAAKFLASSVPVDMEIDSGDSYCVDVEIYNQHTTY